MKQGCKLSASLFVRGFRRATRSERGKFNRFYACVGTLAGKGKATLTQLGTDLRFQRCGVNDTPGYNHESRSTVPGYASEVTTGIEDYRSGLCPECQPWDFLLVMLPEFRARRIRNPNSSPWLTSDKDLKESTMRTVTCISMRRPLGI